SCPENRAEFAGMRANSRRKSDIAADFEEFLAALLLQRFAVDILHRTQRCGDDVAGGVDHGFLAAMRAAHRFGNDAVDDLEVEEVLRGDAHVGSGILGAGRIMPEDRGRTFGRNHRIDRMLEHVDAVCDGDCNRAAGAAFTDDDRDDWNAQLEALRRRAGDGFGLAAFLGADAGIGARSIHEGDERQLEAVGHFHDADSLAVAFRAGRAEIVLETGLGVGALFLPDDGDGLTVEAAETGLKGFVIGELAVAGKRREFGEQPLDIFQAVRAVRMAGDLRLLPRGQLAIDVLQRIRRTLLEATNLVAHLDAALFL